MKINCDAYEEKRCRSCALIEMEYADQLSLKVEKLKNLFPDDIILPSIESQKILEYRNKAKFVIGGEIGNPVLGIPAIHNKFEVNSLLDCPLHEKHLNKIAKFIKEQILEYKLTPYSIKSKKGEFKYLILSTGRQTDEVSIRFGMRSLESFERVKKLATLLQKKFSNIKVISFEVQPKHAALFEGETHFLTPNKYITHDFDDFKLLSSTTNFFQVNSEVAKLLYQKVFDRFNSESINIALDLFCGVGGFAMALSQFSKKVIGIELSENAIDCAKNLAASNIDFFCDDAFKFPDYYQGPIDLLVVNPPRRGIGKEFSELICKLAPKFLVYSSCNPKTLKEDAYTLRSHYELESLTPVDMFALTDHLEVLSIWIRKSE